MRNSRGFTLLEVLLALTVMALVIGVAFTGFSIAVDTWRRGLQRIDDLDRRFAAERLLDRQITLADPFSFVGDGSQLEFTTSYSLTNGPADPVHVRYQIDANGDRGFIYSESPLVQYSSGATFAATENLTGFSADAFKYLYTMPNKEREWTNQTMQDLKDKNKEPLLAVHIGISGDVLNIPVQNKQ